MEAGEKKTERRSIRRSLKGAKSATLPAGAVLTDQPGGGFFSKIRRSLKLRKKNKYTLQQYQDDPEVTGKTSFTTLSSSTDYLGMIECDENGGVANTGLTETAPECKQDHEVVLVNCKFETTLSEPVTNSSVSLENSVGKFNKDDDDQTKAGRIKTGTELSEKCPAVESNNNHKLLDDFDPDYESLDTIREKLHSQHTTDQSSSITSVSHDRTEIDTGQTLPSNQALGGKEQDNGVTVPHMSGVNSPYRLSDPFPDNTKPAHMTDSALSKLSSTVEEDLYANAKVLIRKQIQKRSKSHDDCSGETSDLLSVNQPQSSSTVCPFSNVTGMVAGFSETVSPPPLPARNYSEAEMITPSDKPDLSEHLNRLSRQSQVSGLQSTINIGQKRDKSNVEVNTTMKLENYNIRTEVSDTDTSKTSKRNSVIIEQGPIISLSLYPHSCQGNNCNSDLCHKSSNLPCTQLSQSSVTHNTASEFTNRDRLCEHLKQIEDELLYIDEDSVDGHPPLSIQAEKMEPIDSVALSLASDCMCETGSTHSAFTGGNTTITNNGVQQNQGSGCASSSAVDLIPSFSVLTANNAIDPVPPFPVLTANDSIDRVPSPALTANNTIDLFPSLTASNALDPVLSPALTATNAIDPVPSPPVLTPKTTVSLKRRLSLMLMGKDPSSRNMQPGRENLQAELLDNATGAVPNDRINFSMSASWHAPNVSEPSSPVSPVKPDDGHVGRNHGRRSRHRMRPQSLDLSHHDHRFPDPALIDRGNDIPPPLPARRAKVVLDEVPFRQGRNRGGAAELLKSRRHSSDTTAALAHKDFLKSMKQLKECGWYWGPLSHDEAVVKLKDKCDGSFLVRDSNNDKYLLAISFKCQDQVRHTRIEYHKGLFSFWENPDENSKAHICQFIEQTVANSKKGNFIYFKRSPGTNANPYAIQLLYPVSRFCRVPTLQHLCRFLILRHTRRDHVDCLPLPQKVKGYLLENQYYVEMNAED